MRRSIKWIRWALVALILALGVGLALPERLVIPVSGADENDWNHQTFWYAPWGASGVHRGIDIFAREGTAVIAATDGVVVFTGTIERGGLVAATLGPKWRFHYYAHLSAVDVAAGDWVAAGARIGAVGRTGNAATRPPHLHYAIVTPIPYFWLDLSGPYGWQKMFYLDPHAKLINR